MCDELLTTVGDADWQLLDRITQIVWVSPPINGRDILELRIDPGGQDLISYHRHPDVVLLWHAGLKQMGLIVKFIHMLLADQSCEKKTRIPVAHVAVVQTLANDAGRRALEESAKDAGIIRDFCVGDFEPQPLRVKQLLRF